MSNPFNTGPIAPENNPAIHPEWFAPRSYSISSIAQGHTTTITTTDDHDYVIGQLVRTIVPTFYGMRELNEMQSYVISIPSPDEIIINLDSTGFTAFIAHPPFSLQTPYVIAIGDVNTGYLSTTGVNIPFVGIEGSFINISPAIGQ